MASTFTPTTWPTVLGPYAIDVNDCIGDSVGIINANTNYLASYTAAVSSTASTQIASANTRITALSTVPLARLQDGGQTGNAPIFGARAWVNFNGTGGNGANQIIRGSGNVSSVYRTAGGNYTVYFTVNMPDTYYAAIATSGNLDASTAAESTSTTNRQVSSVQVYTGNAQGGTLAERADISVVIFR